MLTSRGFGCDLRQVGQGPLVALRCNSFARYGTELRFAQEIRRRQVLQVIGLYVVGAWVVIEVAYVAFPARLTGQSGVQVWCETFDRKLEAIFAIQSEIASAVASRIVQEIVTAGSSLAGRATESVEAYDAYLLGRKHAHDRIPGWHANKKTRPQGPRLSGSGNVRSLPECTCSATPTTSGEPHSEQA